MTILLPILVDCYGFWTWRVLIILGLFSLFFTCCVRSRTLGFFLAQFFKIQDMTVENSYKRFQKAYSNRVPWSPNSLHITFISNKKEFGKCHINCEPLKNPAILSAIIPILHFSNQLLDLLIFQCICPDQSFRFFPFYWHVLLLTAFVSGCIRLFMNNLRIKFEAAVDKVHKQTKYVVVCFNYDALCIPTILFYAQIKIVQRISMRASVTFITFDFCIKFLQTVILQSQICTALYVWRRIRIVPLAINEKQPFSCTLCISFTLAPSLTLPSLRREARRSGGWGPKSMTTDGFIHLALTVDPMNGIALAH